MAVCGLSDVAVRWLGVVVASLGGVVLLIVAFAAWWAVGESTTSGWVAAGGFGKPLVVAAVVVGFLPLPIVALPRSVAWGLHAALSGLVLGAALLIVFRLADHTAEMMIGADVTGAAPVAIGACLAIVGGATLAAQGDHLFLDRVRIPIPALGMIGAACVGLVVSLFLPWARYIRVGEIIRLAPITLTGWNADTAAAVLLLLLAVAIMAGAFANQRTRRVVLWALLAAGWLAAAATIVTPLRHRGRPLPFGVQWALAAYQPGYYICLGCAALIVLAGLTAVALPAAGDQHPPDFQLPGTEPDAR